MKGPEINSREFKVMLQARRFIGEDSDVLAAAHAFWHAYRARLEAIETHTVVAIAASGQPEFDDRRRICFFDTTAATLRAHDYVLRQRTDLNHGDKSEVTLKFRHPDRYVARARDMQGVSSKAETKFEEDVKLPFIHIVSYSTTQPVDGAQSFRTLDDIFALYPGFKAEINCCDNNRALVKVGGINVLERTLKGMSFKLKDENKAKCAITIWYDNKKNATTPMVCEFSFKYKLKKNNYFTRADAEIADSAFNVLANGLDDWTDNDGPTKTAFVYSH